MYVIRLVLKTLSIDCYTGQWTDDQYSNSKIVNDCILNQEQWKILACTYLGVQLLLGLC